MITETSLRAEQDAKWYTVYMSKTQPTPYKAPDFSLQSTDGTTVSLKQFAGSWLVFYFYPQDDTPGCTIEACSLRDTHDELAGLGAQVVGVSRDNLASHRQFIGKNKLNFTLLSDPDHKVMDTYGAWGKKMFGVEGVLRKTFIINPDGMVVKVYGRVTPAGHGEQLAAELRRLQNSAS